MTTQLKKINDPFTLFDAIFDDFCGMSDFDAYRVPTFPPTNIYINDNTKDLMFEFAVAGYRKEDVSITFEGDKMMFEVEGKERGIEKDGLKLQHKGIKNVDCKVSYIVPVSKYNTEKAEADIIDGILTVKVPALEVIKPRQLRIR